MPSAEPNGGSLPSTLSQRMEHDDDDEYEYAGVSDMTVGPADIPAYVGNMTGCTVMVSCPCIQFKNNNMTLWCILYRGM